MKVRKPIFAFLILAVLSVIYLVVIGYLHLDAVSDRFQERNKLKIEKVQQIIDSLEKDFSNEREQYLERLQSFGQTMAVMLSEFIEEGTYKGPEIFSNAFIVQIKNGEIIYPEMLGYQPNLDLSLFGPENFSAAFVFRDPEGNAVDCIVNTFKIADSSYYYVDITAIQEILNRIYERIRLEKTISDIENSFECGLLFIYDGSDSDSFLDSSGEKIQFLIDPIEALGLSQINKQHQ